MLSENRFEYKYPLDPSNYLRVRNALVPYMSLDNFSRPLGRYVVRSLYYDTPDFQAYTEKITGEGNRFKLRLRSYSRVLGEAKFINVEIKTKSGEKTNKFVTRISLEEYAHFMRTGVWCNLEDPVLIEFERLRRLKNLRPKTLVEYEREGYVPRGGESVRITFDHFLRYGVASDLFSSTVVFRPHRKSLVVMENKWPDAHPQWLGRIIMNHNLKATPNSKYAASIEHAENRIYINQL